MSIRKAMLALLLLLLLPSPAVAQEPRAHLALSDVRIDVVADTLAGLHLIVLPAKDFPIWLRFHPDSVLEWVNGAGAALRTVAAGGDAKGVQWSRALMPWDGVGGLSLGRSRKDGKLEKAHWLAVAESRDGWRTEISAADADSLIRALFGLAALSRVDSFAVTGGVPATETQAADTRYRGIAGQVAAMFIVEADGRVDRSSFRALVSTDPRLEPAAWTAIAEARFQPARNRDGPVRSLVYRVLTWVRGG